MLYPNICCLEHVLHLGTAASVPSSVTITVGDSEAWMPSDGCEGEIVVISEAWMPSDDLDFKLEGM